jgi:hypothetical protein
MYKFVTTKSFNYPDLKSRVISEWGRYYAGYVVVDDFNKIEFCSFTKDIQIFLISEKCLIPHSVAELIYHSIIDDEDLDEWSAPYSTKSKLRNVFIGVAIDAVLYPALYLTYNNLRDYYYQSYMEYLEDCGKVTTGEVFDPVEVSAVADVSVDIAGNTSALPENAID